MRFIELYGRSSSSAPIINASTIARVERATDGRGERCYDLFDRKGNALGRASRHGMFDLLNGPHSTVPNTTNHSLIQFAKFAEGGVGHWELPIVAWKITPERDYAEPISIEPLESQWCIKISRADGGLEYRFPCEINGHETIDDAIQKIVRPAFEFMDKRKESKNNTTPGPEPI